MKELRLRVPETDIPGGKKGVNRSSGTIRHEKIHVFSSRASVAKKMEILQPSQTTEMQSPMPGLYEKKGI